MENYKPIDLTSKVKNSLLDSIIPVKDVELSQPTSQRTISPGDAKNYVESFIRCRKIRHVGKDIITHNEDINLIDLEQLCEWTQTNTITNIIINLEQYYKRELK